MLRAALLFLLLTSSAHAYIVTIDPQNYAAGTDLSRVGPGAVLSTYTNTGGGAPRFESVIAANQYLARESGSLDFRNLFQAQACSGLFDPSQCVDALEAPSEAFGVFRVDFAEPTSFFELTTFMPEYASDGAFLIAFNSSGARVRTCDVPGGQGGALPNVRGPRYSPSGPAPPGTFGDPCGDVLLNYPANVGDDCATEFTCNRIMTARVESAASDIAFVLWGGQSSSATRALVQSVRYETGAPTSVPEPGTAALLLVGLLGARIYRRRTAPL